MHRAEAPKVSIGMPVYNGAEYIAEAIESVLAQTYKNYQLIICDNCSTDKTQSIVADYRDPRITYVRHPENIGGVNNANSCLELADGDYVYIFHHDDIMMPTNLERKVEVLMNHPEVGFVHSNFSLIDANGKILSEQSWDQKSWIDYIEDGKNEFNRYIKLLPMGARIFIGTVMVRRSCYQKAGHFNPKFPHCNDSEMWLRLLLNENVACIGEPLVKYRIHQMSTSSDWGDFRALPYLKEHYETAKEIFKHQKEKIVNPKKLEKKVKYLFADHALQLSIESSRKRNFIEGRKFLKLGTQMYPKIIQSVKYWKAIVKIILNDKGLDLYYLGVNKITRKNND